MYVVFYSTGRSSDCTVLEVWTANPSEYGPQYILTPPPPHSHTLSVYNVHWEGGRGKEVREKVQ
jgi:hypothetical protein